MVTQPSLRRMREFAIRPDRELGQNFLVDSNVLGVIGGLAELAPADVVLEVGGGLGVLSEYLAERVAHVHVVELDERLRAALQDAVGSAANVTLHWGDALKVDLAGMRPCPNKVVANLPYGVAAGALLRTIEELPSVGRWVAMVQREVGERLAAAPGGRIYGAPSVLAQLTCEVRVARAVARTVFSPVPNVDSVLVLMVRRVAQPEVAPELRRLVADAFAHRRKTLVRSLALAAAAAGHAARTAHAYDGDAVRAALVALGHPPDARAERLSPEDFRALAELLSTSPVGKVAPRVESRWHTGKAPARAARDTRGMDGPLDEMRLRARAPAKINLGLFVGAVRADGRHELVTVMQSISLADELALRAAASGDRDVVLCPALAGAPSENLAARALAAFRAATGWEGPPLELRVDKRVPVAAGLGGGSGDAAAALRLAAVASGLGEEQLLLELGRELGADVPAQVRPGRWLARGAGEQLYPLPEPRAPFGVLVLPAAAALATAAVYARADRIGALRNEAELQERYDALARELAQGAPLPAVELLGNDLQEAARVLCPEIDTALAQARAAGADVALVSGSGPTVLGLFVGADGPDRARAAVEELHAARQAAGVPAALAAVPIGERFAAVVDDMQDGPAARTRDTPAADARVDLPMRHNAPR